MWNKKDKQKEKKTVTHNFGESERKKGNLSNTQIWLVIIKDILIHVSYTTCTWLT